MKIFYFVFLTLSVLLFACGQNPQSGPEPGPKAALTGKEILKKQCVVCHGADGRLGLNGAKMLPESALSLEQRIALIQNGKGAMPPFRNLLSPEEIAEVAAYTQSLK